MIGFQQALEFVLTAVKPLQPVEKDLADIRGCVLAEDIRSPEDIPPFSRSTMDGYAVRSRDFTDGVAGFRVVEDLPAGVVPRRELAAGEAARIFTGAMLPRGADSVIVQEQAQVPGGRRVRFSAAPRRGQFVLKAGQIARRGDILLRRGEVLRTPAIALLASIGVTRVHVHPSPRTSLLATGDELVEPDSTPNLSQVRNSNAHMLLAALRDLGVDARYLGIARDTSDSLRPLLEKGLSSDLFLISGGVSVGERDLVGRELRQLGVEPIFTRVAVKPGKPLFFGTKGACSVFGLPGNPASSFVTFELFVRPAIAKMRALGERRPVFESATLATTVNFRRDRLTFVPAALRREGTEVVVQPIKYAGSADILAVTRADCLASIPRGDAPITAGSRVNYLLIRSEKDYP